MKKLLHGAWDSFLRPLVQRPKKLQVAALCYRGDGADREYLLISSRDTGRWVIPKGWPIRGLELNETALQEAWEEAGVQNSTASTDPIGAFSYSKRQPSGWSIPVRIQVFSVRVHDLADEFPEAHERTRIWVKAKDAAKMVQEVDLKAIFLDL
ncbi:NUDIX hydrolase [Pseudoruegeria sp. SK021]|uniref:NUDIX hydrolase n=1 Tax=Pseudoruegeria sp. SK021 TaxID=1933035 RepID=UPI000A243B92|nr:NUDIX hydrolase [Pseudoruegeria sp. SK021]OSP55791.1 NUDIX hydrolase [Pseudoruegeria sp. SK021]